MSQSAWFGRGLRVARRERPTGACRSQRGLRPVMVAAAPGVRIDFSLPYRVEFGQHLCIIGGDWRLGGWDMEQAVQMQWSDGDVWQTSLLLPANEEVLLEYKYVVRDDSGCAVAWKPGENCCLAVPLPDYALPQHVRVADDWLHCSASIEVDAPPPPPPQQAFVPLPPTPAPAAQPVATTPAAEQGEEDIRQRLSRDRITDPPTDEEGEPNGFSTAARNGDLGYGTGSSSRAAQGTGLVRQQPAAPPLAHAVFNEVDVVKSAAARAMKDLDASISASDELLTNLGDPTSESAFIADRIVAAAARKALTLSKALSAADANYSFGFLRSEDEDDEISGSSGSAMLADPEDSQQQ